MILPGSYANGFAPRDGMPLYPELWRGCVFAAAPCLGPSGLVLRDWSGRANHGALTNMDAADWVTSHGRYALDFDGTNDYVTMGSPERLRLNSDVSVAAWVYPRSTSRLAIIGHATSGVAYFIMIFSLGLNEKLSFWNSAGGPVVTAPNVSTLNTWHHFGAKRTAAGVELFINGISVATAAGATGNGTSAGEFTIGRFGSFNSYLSSSMIMETTVWSRGLSASEFALLATRPGIMYEAKPRRRSLVQVVGGFKAAWVPRQRLIVGGGL